MTKMHGPAAVRAIRGLGYKGVIIGLTGNTLSDDIITFLDSGVNGVLIKPLDLKLFLSTFLKYYNGLDVVNSSSVRLGMQQRLGVGNKDMRNIAAEPINFGNRVLVVSGSAQSSTTLARSMELFGFTVTVACTVDDALVELGKVRGGGVLASVCLDGSAIFCYSAIIISSTDAVVVSSLSSVFFLIILCPNILLYMLCCAAVDALVSDRLGG